MKIMKIVFNIIYWLASVMFIILGLTSPSEEQFISGAISLVVGIVINPLFYKFLSEKLELRGKKYKFRHYVMVSMALCVINILIFPSDADETDNSASGNVQAENVEKNSEAVKVCTYNDVLNNFIILYNNMSDNKIDSVEDPSAYGDKVTGTTKINGFTVTLRTSEKDSWVEDDTILSVTIDAEDITRDKADEMKIVFLDFYKTLCGKDGSELWNTISDKFDDSNFINQVMTSDGNMYWECSKIISSDSKHRDYSISLLSDVQYIPDLEY